MPEFLDAGGRPAGLLGPFLILVLLELLWLRHRRPTRMDWRESAASTAIALGNRLIRPLTGLLLTPLFLAVARQPLLDWPLSGLSSFVAVFLIVDFTYYGFHRASHRVRWLWASHSVHHSSQHLNLSAAYRLAWTDLFSGAWVWLLALVWLGLPLSGVVGSFALNLAFQFFLHTELVGRLGPLEWLFNTPSHHRVHHACNENLLDRNFGGVLIVWDRLFGSHAREPDDASLRYGLHGQIARYNPLAIVFGEWRRLLNDLRQTRGWRARLRIALAPP